MYCLWVCLFKFLTKLSSVLWDAVINDGLQGKTVLGSSLLNDSLIYYLDHNVEHNYRIYESMGL